MAVLIDPPAWPAHGTVWAHLVSDVSYDELHAFAAAHGVPRRGFERDHYDVPERLHAALVAGGARPVSSRELLERLSRAGLRRRKSESMARRAPGVPLLRPRRLRAGDLVAVTAPAGPVPADRLAAGVARLETWGLRVRVMPHVLQVGDLPHLAGSDAERAADFSAAWLDDEVSGVIAARGGYGVQRILDHLDWRRLAEGRPKVLAGFSDITALHQAVAGQLGLVTLHSHVATSLGAATTESAERMRSMLFDPSVVDLLAGEQTTVLAPGTAAGVLMGGNLSLLAAELGTPYSRPARGAIVLLEEVEEPPYRIDRLLTQLLRSGWFEGARAIVVGAFTGCGVPAQVDAVLADRLLPLGVPTVAGLDVGHTATSGLVPFGVAAELKASGSSGASLTLATPPLR